MKITKENIILAKKLGYLFENNIFYLNNELLKINFDPYLKKFSRRERYNGFWTNYKHHDNLEAMLILESYIG